MQTTAEPFERLFRGPANFPSDTRVRARGRNHRPSPLVADSRDGSRLRIGEKTAADLWRSWPSRANYRPGQPDV
jgi:hypothetical protein